MTELDVWAAKRGLQVQTYMHWEAEVKRVLLIDSGSDVYEFFVRNDPEVASAEPGHVRVGVSLVKRGSRRHHAFHRERMQYTYTVDAAESQIQQALDACFSVAEGWVSEVGHALQ